MNIFILIDRIRSGREKRQSRDNREEDGHDKQQKASFTNAEAKLHVIIIAIIYRERTK